MRDDFGPLQQDDLREALLLIAAGRSDLVGAASVSEAWFAAVRLARTALGLCGYCRRDLDGCAECRGLHGETCCGCSDCSCGCGG